MTDQTAPAPAETPQPKPKPLNNYKITCNTGFQIAVASPDALPEFVARALGTGGVPSDKMWINMTNIVSIEYIGQFVPNGGVVAQLGPRPVS